MKCLLVLLFFVCVHTKHASFYPAEPSLDQYKVEIDVTQSLTPLRQIADRTSVYVGAARNYNDNQRDSEYVKVINTQYNLNTAENGCKWYPTQPHRNQFSYAECTYVADAAKNATAAFRGHNLAWNVNNPPWLNSSLSSTELVQALETHVTTLVSHYKQYNFLCWDVVNEAISDSGPGIKPSVWYPAVPNYIDIAFRAARVADPNVKLFYNDYSAEGRNSKSDRVYELVKGMKERGVPIDGVGFQMHVSTSYYPPPADVDSNMKRLAQLGLEVHITEMDCVCPDPCDLQKQATIYSAMLEVCLSNPNCKSFETWGFTDKYTWEGTNKHPLPFDENYQPKPAAYAIEAVFKKYAKN